MFEIRILIPLANNEGQKFLPETHDEFDAFVIARFGGLSRSGSVEGAWMNEGHIYRDQTIDCRVAISSIVEGSKIGEVVEFAKAHYEQKAIYVSYLGLSEIL